MLYQLAIALGSGLASAVLFLLPAKGSLAALFIGVTMAFPYGLAGLFESHVKPWWKRRMQERRTIRERLREDELAAKSPPLQTDPTGASAIAVQPDGPGSMVIRRSTSGTA